ncbi:MAG: ComF family protein [Pirellulales bacterium]|nr:ComF family protein [Pirellulales bacterium]
MKSCYRCKKAPPRFDIVVPLGQYRNELRETELRDAVLRMKRRHYDHLSTTMSRLYTAHRGQQVLDLQPDVVVPVPMHWTRRIRRGTNSAEMLAAEIAQNLRLEAAPKMLIRSRKTLPQMELQPEQRAQNVRNAFRLAKGYDIHGARVLLVDDILTTGATCNEVARVLKRAGAQNVIVSVIARAEGFDRR